jgi:hypothetical protein
VLQLPVEPHALVVQQIPHAARQQLWSAPQPHTRAHTRTQSVSFGLRFRTPTRIKKINNNKEIIGRQGGGGCGAHR